MRIARVEADNGPFLDLERAVAQAGPEQAAPAASWRRSPRLGLLLSLALHLLPLLLLLPWRAAPVEAPPPIPVQLVLEQPPPPPPAPVARAEPAAKPPRGRLSSEETGAPADEPIDAAGAQPDAQADAQPEPAPSRQATAEPEPEPRQAASPVQPQPQPTEPSPEATSEPKPELKQKADFVQPQHEPSLLSREALALPTPEIEPLSEKPVAPASPHRPASGQTPRPLGPQHAAAVIGLPAIRDEYLAHLVTLVRPHLNLLTSVLVNGRRGTTSLAIRVLGDGTIARIAVSQSSGYPDIDNRIIQIVAAVGRFPPLPPWVEQPSLDIYFHLRFPFPEAAQRP